ncbi:hypothetical protein [Chitinophaga defluvii]|uniref:Glycosyl hydrolase-like family 15 (GHL15) protein n=1 Tax=Chitinophaga defluvii TaxID=3163343 RepID=A0ABV2SZS8_9BACT
MQRILFIPSLVILLLAIVRPAAGQKGNDQFLISIYSPPPATFINDEQYQLMKAAHIDYILNIGPGVTTDKAGNLKTLDMALKHGLKVYVYDARINGNNDSIKALVGDYKAHPALAGYYITDEPDSGRLQKAIDIHKLVTALDNKGDAYVNHLPDWAVPGYEAFLERWINGVGKENLNYLAYDNYPYKRKQSLEKTYFNNLNIIRTMGLKYQIKTSSCLQSFGMYFSGVEELRRPNPDEMRMNVYSNLAYGVKNAVWYPYWSTIRHGDVITMSPCIVDTNGTKTDLYAPFKVLNGAMKQLGKTLIHLDAQEVYHTGDSLWIGTTHPPENFLWKVLDKGADVILSHMVNPKTGKEYIMVVNKSFKVPKQFTFQLKNTFKKVMEISQTTGKPVKSTFDRSTHQLKAAFLPGEGKLYELSE